MIVHNGYWYNQPVHLFSSPIIMIMANNELVAGFNNWWFIDG